MGSKQSGQHGAPAHAFDEDLAWLCESLCAQPGNHGSYGMLCEGAAEIRWSAGLAIAGLRHGDSQVSAAGKLMEHAPLDIDLSSWSRLWFLMSVEKDDGRPRPMSGRLFQEILNMSGRIVRMGDGKSLSVQDLTR